MKTILKLLGGYSQIKGGIYPPQVSAPASHYGVLHPVMDIIFMQTLIVSQISNSDTLVWRLGQIGDVALGHIEKCDLQNRRCVTFANFFHISSVA